VALKPVAVRTKTTVRSPIVCTASCGTITPPLAAPPLAKMRAWTSWPGQACCRPTRLDDDGRGARRGSITPVADRTRPSMVRPSWWSVRRDRRCARGAHRPAAAGRDLQAARIGDAEQLGFGRDELAEIPEPR
jgi:hypothetical protein